MPLALLLYVSTQRVLCVLYRYTYRRSHIIVCHISLCARLSASRAVLPGLCADHSPQESSAQAVRRHNSYCNTDVRDRPIDSAPNPRSRVDHEMVDTPEPAYATNAPCAPRDACNGNRCASCTPKVSRGTTAAPCPAHLVQRICDDGKWLNARGDSALHGRLLQKYGR